MAASLSGGFIPDLPPAFYRRRADEAAAVDRERYSRMSDEELEAQMWRAREECIQSGDIDEYDAMVAEVQRQLSENGPEY
jgi:hypothetical protein